MKRRHVLAAMLGGTSALVVGWSVLPARQRLLPSTSLADSPGQPAFNGWVRIGVDDTVTVVMSRSEMGQGVYTALTMVLADELDAHRDQVRTEQAPIDRIYNNQAVAVDGLPFHPDSQNSLKHVAQHLTAKTMREIGLMMTGGSSSIKDLWLPMRQAGASARAMLVAAAASQWQVAAAEIQIQEGVVSHASGKSARFGELAALAAQQARPENPKLKTANQFTLIGQSVPRIEGTSKVDGSAVFGINARPPGLMYAMVGMNPEVGGTFQIFDETQIKPIPGVKRIVTLPELYGSTTGIAVVAKSTYLSMKILRQLTVEWCAGKANELSDSHIRNAMDIALDSSSGFTYFSSGDAEQALTESASQVKADYSVPYLAHAPMEPPNCTVWFKEGRAEVWVGTQIPDLARHVVAQVLGIADDKVQLHLMLIGSSFGRRLEMDFIAQAAFIAKACEGTPVQALWDRSQDLQHDFYRPACISRFTAGLDDKGQLKAWKNTSASQAVLPQILNRLFGLPSAGPDKTTAEGAFDQPYEWLNASVTHSAIELPMPVGFWRSVGHSHQAFFKESFIDEVAHAAKQDPLAFRLSLLQKHPRHARVLQLAADKSGWKTTSYKHADGSLRAMGLALHESFGSIVAQVVEVSVKGGKPQVHKVWCAIDCGTAVNPDLIAQQIEGAVAFGLSAALYGQINLDKGRVQQNNFHNYPVLRLPQMPVVETFIVESVAHPQGVGEPGTPPIAPAVANALYILTGQRLRSLPLIPDATQS